MPGVVRRHPIVAFFLLSYAVTWLAWLPDRLIAPDVQSVSLSWWGSFGPAVAAILVTALCAGGEGLRDLLAHLFRWRLPLRWYVVTLVVPPISVLIPISLYALGGSFPPDYDPAKWAALFPQLLLGWTLGVLLGLVVTVGEEMGWRGYAVPKLQETHSALSASIIVGVLWGFWHFPPYLIPDTGPDLTFAFLFVVGTTSAAVIYTWLYNHTRGSLVIACLFHSVYDMTAITAGVGIPFPIFPGHVAALAIIAAVIVVMAGPARLSREPITPA